MTPTGRPEKFWREAGITYYLTVGLSALGAIGLVLLQRGFGAWSLVPILIGLIAGLTRFGAVALVLIVAVLINAVPHLATSVRHSLLNIPDVVLCAAVLGYAIAHSRLQSLINNVFPAETAKHDLKARASPADPRRPARLVTPDEVSALVISLPFWAILAVGLWRLRSQSWHNPGVRPDAWEAILIVWMVGAPFWALAVFFKYWALRRMSVDEAQLLLQDTLWHETRREQRRINRWLAWARLRRPN
jgi:hypothetical protein